MQPVAEGVELLSLPETGTAPGAAPGRGKGRETGASRGYLVPVAGQMVPGAASNRRAGWLYGRAEAPPSHTWRGLVLSCRTGAVPPGTDTRTADSHRRQAAISVMVTDTRRSGRPHGSRDGVPPDGCGRGIRRRIPKPHPSGGTHTSHISSTTGADSTINHPNPALRQHPAAHRRRDAGQVGRVALWPQPSACAVRVGRPAARQAWKPPSRSVAIRRPIRRRLAAASVDA